ncbi:prepilin-type N-terminal cleavage/methylation domain-containing protein [Rhodopirellula rubra]|uniref:Prepilin-type N-terminal cleavage/methylation domain-containing protein n=2 Tax=Aporhodopirellula rubra TaxID=980271 RepID=A0A7W5H7E0_9BACT|nr:prepilin-type N-terminal cleavage/methylation domain-containing protein [Aporhodopirellula rubra]
MNPDPGIIDTENQSAAVFARSLRAAGLFFLLSPDASDPPQMKTNRSGFTLVELLVVITIIGILMGLLIPAVNAARETARRNQCSTQLKNLALAAIQHENAKGELPGYVQEYGNYSTGTDPSDPTGTAPANHVKLGTWAVALFPWLDAQPTYEHWTEDRYPILTSTGGEFDGTSGSAGDGFHSLAAPNLAIMQCPSNPNSDSENARNSYVTNNGMVPLPPATSGSPTIDEQFEDSMKRANGAFNNKFAGDSDRATGPKVRLDDFKDGQGNTMLFSENVQALPWNRPGLINGAYVAAATVNYPDSSRFVHGMVWHYEDSDFAVTTMPWSNGTPVAVNAKHLVNGRGATTAEDIFVETIVATNATDLARPSSAHTDGVNAGMADGGTRFITDSVDYRVYQALLTLRGKASDVPWPEFILDDDAY